MMPAGMPARAPGNARSAGRPPKPTAAACAATPGIQAPPDLRTPVMPSPGQRAAPAARPVTPYSGRTFSACGPFCPWVVSNSTFWFSSSDR
jgi:hypothetical protein